jgi:PKD repeat protein
MKRLLVGLLVTAWPAGPAAAASGAPTPIARPYARGQQLARTATSSGKRIDLSTAFSHVPPLRERRGAEEEEHDEGLIPPFEVTAPVGPPIPIEQPPPSQPPPPALGRSEGRDAAAAGLSYFTNTNFASSSPFNQSTETPEPSVATNGSIVFTTGNWYAGLSADGGRTFSYVNPYTDFPKANGGFCCDQVALYEPSRDLLLWRLQYVNDAAGNTIRLFVSHGASNEASLRGVYYDFTPQNHGFAAGYWFDFGDLGLSANYLYMTANVFAPSGNQSAASIVFRIPLDGLAAGGSITWSYWTLTDVGSPKAVEGATTTMYFTTHPSFSAVRLYRLDEATQSLTYTDTSVSPFQGARGQASCPDPSGVDWCANSDSRVLGAWRAGGQIGVMWTAGQQTTFPFPYVQIAVLNESDASLLQQNYIWSNQIAFQYPSVGLNAHGGLAGTIAYGGGGRYASVGTWIADDLNGHTFAPLEYYQAVVGTSSPAKPRFGDYFTTRQSSQYPGLWTTIAAAPTLAAAGSEPHYILFGRARDGPSGQNPPTAGFTFSPASPVTGQGIGFLDTSTGSPSSWSWAFGDGTTSFVQNPIKAYGLPGSYNVTLTASNSSGSGTIARTVPVSSSGSACTANATTLCLSAGRFQVRATWQSTTASGQGTAVSLTPDTGYFWFFNSANVEMIVKVLDACALNSKKWVFGGGLTNVFVVITVADTQTGTIKTYVNPQGAAFQPIQDTAAFSTCP